VLGPPAPPPDETGSVTNTVETPSLLTTTQVPPPSGEPLSPGLANLEWRLPRRIGLRARRCRSLDFQSHWIYGPPTFQTWCTGCTFSCVQNTPSREALSLKRSPTRVKRSRKLSSHWTPARTTRTRRIVSVPGPRPKEKALQSWLYRGEPEPTESLKLWSSSCSVNPFFSLRILEQLE